MVDLNIIYSIIALQRPFLKLIKHGSFFRTKDINKTCDIDLNQKSKIENLRPFLLDLIKNLIDKQKTYDKLQVIDIELDTVIDNRIQSILNELNNLNFNLHYLLSLNTVIYPKQLKLNVDKTLPDIIQKKITKLINNYNNNYTSTDNLINLKNIIRLHSYLKKNQKIIVKFNDFNNIINNTLSLNSLKINIDNYLINKFTINIIYDNIPVSNIIYYKAPGFSKLEYTFKFSNIYNHPYTKISYYNILKLIRSFIKVYLRNKDFPKYLFISAKTLKEKMDLLSEDKFGKYSYRMRKYELLYKNTNNNYKKKYKKYFKKINKYALKYISNNIVINNKLYNYLLDNIKIKF
jgi:hypothetical protein